MNSPTKNFLYLITAVLFLQLMSCSKKDSVVTTNPYDTTKGNSPIPKSPGMISYPADNPQTDAKIDLGRHLFYDKSLSPDGTTSCASCHKLSSGFADIFPTSLGVNGERGPRNAPSLVNIAYNASFNWDGRFASLEHQALCPIYNFQQLGNNFGTQIDSSSQWTTYNSQPGNFDSLFLYHRMNQRPSGLQGESYPDMFIKVWGTATITMDHIAKSLAAFERTIISTNSDFDKYNNGDATVLSKNPEAIHGYQIFIDAKGANCIGCHNGYNFTDGQFHDNGIGFNSKIIDHGRINVTKDQADLVKFKTPTLRNVALTAPYMHDGRFATLEQVIKNYNKGGTHTTPNQDPRIKSLNMSDQDVSDLAEFLKTLTDHTFVADTSGNFSNPWGN